MRVVPTLLVAVSLCNAQAANPSAESLFNQALAAQQNGDLQAAIASYERVLKLMPGLVPARANLAAAQVQAGHIEAGVANYKKALQQDPQNARLTVLLGDVYVRQRRYVEALSILEPAEKAHPDNLDIAFVLGEALIDTNRLVDGLKRIERVAKLRNDVNSWTLAALAELRLAQYEKAAASAESVLRLDPSFPGAYTLSGMSKAALGDNEGATAAYRKALEIDQGDFDANLRLGTLLLRDRQDVPAARAYLEHALRLNPGSLSAVYEMGQLAVAEKRDADAIADFEQVSQQAPNLLQPHIRLAALYARTHRTDDAAREKQTVDRLIVQQQRQDPNALPDDLLPPQFNASPAPSH